ncbi:MAG TPA: RHS repeat-associated core domain-containing protein, partial [Polyangiaceae bacterium]|nr:RHS repeat-associated core domain-containing protein [Polyangiaceae bacterium]
VRWMAYDSLGRMILNVDPHATTTATYSETPSHAAGIRAWHYVYNDAGDLVGTSDARGCGQNFVYDGAGRLKAEDYSPCEKEQASYVAPNLTTGAGYEVFYEYDDTVSTVVSAPSGLVETSDHFKGRLKAVHDRAATTWFNYDARGRTTTTYRKVSYVGAPQTTVAGRYVDRWYSKDFFYDAADRPVEETTGVASDSELRATDETSSVKTAYTDRGTLKHVDSSYGMLVSSIKRSADGLVGQLTFGDAAATQTAMRYDSRRRLSSVQTFRSEASLWSTPPPSISPVPGASDATRQLLLQDLDYSYDVVNNPVEIRDWRTADEWPDGAKPSTRRMEYDDLYRVTRVDYEYPGGFDDSVSPYASEIAGSNADPRRPIPSGHRLFPRRPLWHSYNYDWLGNTTKTDDDQHAFWDRSLGAVTNSSTKPYQFNAAAQSSQYGGSIISSNVFYDAAGNLAGLQVARGTANCAPNLAVCSSRWFYHWDEVGRLATARRLEGSGPSGSGPWFDYLYDANDERVVKQVFYVGGDATKLSTLYIFDSLEIRRSEFNITTLQYPINSDTEVAYLSASGTRLARLHLEPPAKGEPRLTTEADPELYAPNLHVLLTLPDHLGSSSLIIDHATSELVEARTYQPYGATESDYRPERWKGFREDYGFTGKEEDIEVGLQYFGKRYLSPYLGRWISADPAGIHTPGEADWNLYAYVSGRLLRSVDPQGLTPPEYRAEIAIGQLKDAPRILTEKWNALNRRVETAARNAFFKVWGTSEQQSKANYEKSKQLQDNRGQSSRVQVKQGYSAPLDDVVKGTGPAASTVWLMFMGGMRFGPAAPAVATTSSGALSRVGDLASIAERARTALGIQENFSVNVAVFEVKAGESYYYVAARSLRGAKGEFPEGTYFGHSERIADKVRADLGVEKAQVTRIFSERAPCSNPGAYCSKMIGENYPGAEVTTVTNAAGKEGEQAIKGFYDARAQAQAAKKE